MVGYLFDGYSTKDEAYFAGARRDYVDALPNDPGAAVLELGCGAGATGALALQAGKCATYVGIEMFEAVAAKAEQLLTRVHVGDVATMTLPYEGGSFDALICSEVLEHLVDPAAVLRQLVKLVKPGGLILASSPNISHWRIVSQLVCGRFEYAREGPMDYTHLRWFTPFEFRRLFERSGVEVDVLQPVGGRHGLSGWLSEQPLGHLWWYQIDLRGRAAPHHER